MKVIVGKVYPYRPGNLTRSKRPGFIISRNQELELDGMFVMVRSIPGDICHGKFISVHPLINTNIMYSFHIDQLGDRITSDGGENYIARAPLNLPGPAVKHV